MNKLLTGQEAKDARNELGIGQKAAGELVGVSQATVMRIERLTTLTEGERRLVRRYLSKCVIKQRKAAAGIDLGEEA